jgi:hypothetical protein
MPKKTYTQINSVTLASSSGSVTFSSIPQNFRDLVLTINGSGINASGVIHLMYFNSDFTDSNYSSVRVYGAGGTATSDSAASPRIGNIYANNRNFVHVQIMDYSVNDKHKTYLAKNSMFAGDIVITEAGRWANAAAVVGLRVNPNSGYTYNAGTTFTLYGIEA